MIDSLGFKKNKHHNGMASKRSYKEKRLRNKNHFAYEASSPLKRLEATFFNVVVDTAIESLTNRFETLGEVRARFGELLNFPNLDDQ